MSQATDLSPGAIAARERARRNGRDGGYTGREMIQAAASVFDRAKQLRKVGDRRPPGKRRQRAHDKADEALATAAAQIRIAQAIPLDRAYLHAMTLDRIQEIRGEVAAAMGENPAALAVDTHRRIQGQRSRAAMDP